MTLLLVDDDKLILSYIRSRLNWSRYGFDVILEAANGLEALSIARAQRVDMIICDIYMPVMNGLELIDGLKQLGLSPAVFVISNYDDFSYVKTALKNGAVDYVLKHELDESKLKDFVAQFLRREGDGPSETAPVTGTPLSSVRAEMKKAVFFIELNYKTKFTLEDIAEYCGLSSAYFSTLFSKTFGVSFSDYLVAYRIQKAERLLTRSALKVNEIAELSGFSDYNYFIKTFKRLTGRTPSEYRREN